MSFLKRLFTASQLPFIMLTGSLAVWLVGLPLFQDGMFMDGTQYAAVARNLARGVGTFWFPVLAKNSVGGLDTFMEHPPLVFFLQSLFFKVFGLHSIYPERIYCLTTLLLTAFFINLLWRKAQLAKPELKALGWLPILLWIIMPVVFWAYSNNIQENTMGLFTTAAVFFLWNAAESHTPLKTPWLYIAVICIVDAFFSKGVPGLFPLAFFPIYFVTQKGASAKNTIIATGAMLMLLGAALFLVLLNPEAKKALHIWFYNRMLQRIQNDPVEASHFHILKGLFLEQLPSLILVFLLLLLFHFKKISNRVQKKTFTLFLLLGFSASLPLMLTLVQRNFYFTPALPLFAIGWALLVAEGVQHLTIQLNSTYLKLGLVITSTAFITGTGFTIFKAGTAKRDKEMLKDVYTLQKLLPENSTVSVPSEIMWNNWSFRCYMMRYNSVSFTTEDTCKYFVGYKGGKVPEDCQTQTTMNQFTLCKRP
jgi:hypothetical protein